MDVQSSSGHADYEWVIGLHRMCLGLLGIWPEIDETVQSRLKADVHVIVILNIMIWSSAVPSVHSLFRVWDDITSVIDNLQYTLPLIISISKLFLMWRRKKAFIPILQIVKMDWIKLKTESERTIMIKRARSARMIMMWGFFVMLFTFILVVIFPLCNISLRYLTNVTDPGKLMPMQTYYIYNVSNSPFYEVTFMLQSFSLLAAAAIYTGTDTFMGLLIFHVSAQLENLKARVLSLDKFSDFEDALSTSVRDHIRLIRFIKAIDNMFTVMLLGIMIYFGILFALYGFLFVTILTQGRNLSIVRLVFILTSFTNTFTHMCLYCVVGEFLVIQVQGIYEAFCQCEWYNLKPRQVKDLLIVMIQTSRPLYLTAGKLFPMTMATFCQLLKTSGGYISVLLAYRD